MKRIASHLAALAGQRQVELTVRANRVASAAVAAVRAAQRDLAALVRGDSKIPEFWNSGIPAFAGWSPWASVEIQKRLRELPARVVGAMAQALARQAVWAHRQAARALVRSVPRRLLARQAVRRLTLREAMDWEDLLADLRGGEQVTQGDLAALLFPPPSEDLLRRVVFGGDWVARLTQATSLARPEALAGVLSSGLAMGQSQQDIARTLQPVVQGVASTARRIARTESMRVAAAVQMQAHQGLGDLVVGYQIHATLDQNTRPEHRARDGTIYWAEPRADQKGYDQMPHPPMEADGSYAWGCRCYVTPVLREPGGVQAGGRDDLETIPVWADWFEKADASRRVSAVGARRYALVQDQTGLERPGYEHFLDPDTGGMLPVEALKIEPAGARMVRIARITSTLAIQRQQKTNVGRLGFVSIDP